jgi:hypothetical protein
MSDEAGCFTFNRDNRASKYFIVCTVAMDSCEVGNGLLELRRDMVWRKLPVREEFHACEDKNQVRNEVYDYLKSHDFRVDITILEKSKAQPQVRLSPQTFYKYAWYYHFRHIGPEVMRGKTELHITAASIGTNKGQAVYTAAVNDVIQQTVKLRNWATFFPRAIAEPCLQVADYCAWAVQRKWERGDDQWLRKIEDKIATQFDLWRTGTKHYY